PCRPETLYGAAKHGTYLSWRALCAQAGAELAWGRLFHLFGRDGKPSRGVAQGAGARQRGEAIGRGPWRAARDPPPRAARGRGDGRATALLAGPGASGPYNVCGGQPVTLRALVEIVGELLGRKELLRFGARPAADEPDLWGDVARLRGLGFAPLHPTLRAGLA